MDYEFDPGKSAKNKADRSRGFGLELANYFEWSTCYERQDLRKNYGEKRFISIGFIYRRLYVAVWTPRGNKRRIISLRKANDKDRKIYEKEKTKRTKSS